MKNVEIKMAKNGAALYYVEGKRVSREVAHQTAAENHKDEDFTIEYIGYNSKLGRIAVNTLTTKKMNLTVRQEAGRHDIKFYVVINGENVNAFCGRKACDWLVREAKKNANAFAEKIFEAYINGAAGVKLTNKDEVIPVAPAITEANPDDYAIAPEAMDVAINAEIELANSEVNAIEKYLEAREEVSFKYNNAGARIWYRAHAIIEDGAIDNGKFAFWSCNHDIKINKYQAALILEKYGMTVEEFVAAEKEIYATYYPETNAEIELASNNSDDNEITFQSALANNLTFEHFVAMSTGTTVEAYQAKKAAEIAEFERRQKAFEIKDQINSLENTIEHHVGTLNDIITNHYNPANGDGSWEDYTAELGAELANCLNKLADLKAQLATLEPAENTEEVADTNTGIKEEPPMTNNLPTGIVTAETGAEAFSLVAPYFPNGLSFKCVTKGFNNEDEYIFYDGGDMYLNVYLTKDNSRGDCLEVLNCNENGSKRHPLTVGIEKRNDVEDEQIKFVATQLTFPNGNETDSVREYSKTFNTIEEAAVFIADDNPFDETTCALAYEDSYFGGIWFAGWRIEDNNGNILYNVDYMGNEQGDETIRELVDKYTDTAPVVDDFQAKLADLQDEYDAAIIENEKAIDAVKAAEKALQAARELEQIATSKRIKAGNAIYNFGSAKAAELRDKLLPIENSNRASIFIPNQLDCRRNIYLETIAIEFYDYKFQIIADTDLATYTLAEYDTPAQVENAIATLKVAITLGDKEFTFPTVDELNAKHEKRARRKVD